MTKENTSEASKMFRINIPIYIIPFAKESKGLFGAQTLSEMVDNLYENLQKFPVTELPSKGKSKTTRITSLFPKIVDMGGVPALLIQASVFESNLKDTFIRNGEEQSKLSDSGQVGGHNYFILFYPKIEGMNSEEYVYTWLQLVYEDPNHNTGVATAVAKKIVEKQLNKQPFNVKLQSAINDFKTIAKNCPEVKVTLTSVFHREETRFPKYEGYCASVKVKEEEEITYNNMPIEIVEELFQDSSIDDISITKKSIFGKFGNKEYHVKRTRYEDAKEWKETVEQLFNSVHLATKEDIESQGIYKIEYILNVFRTVLENYLKNQ